ncbi:MAG: SRPBCC family protein [Flavobacteriales bacterium]|nr:SRPBCC family protein [Flavobacteriales bacterium]
MTHVLEREQFLPISLEEAWDFFATPRNLAQITPPDMGFVIRQPFDDRPMYTGQLIRYTVRPVARIPLLWVTRIDEVEPMRMFVDTQLKGPYKRWWHRHTFEAVPGGVLMRDRVEYELPLGPLGELAHAIFVGKRLEHIFAYRFTRLQALFRQRTTVPSAA